jgi:hypothetical protein
MIHSPRDGPHIATRMTRTAETKAMPPRTPTRTDAYVQCNCGGTMSITTVEPVPDNPVVMRHTYQCLDCGEVASFLVAKKDVGKGAGEDR